MYLTPAQFRAMDFGVSLDGLSDSQIAARLLAASADVDTFCAVPLIPQKHDFRGGTITGETHTWKLDPYDRTPTRRVYPWHTPVIEITSMRIHVTPDQYVELDADHVYYEASEGWAEPFDASLTSYGLFGAGVLPFIGMSQPYVKIDYTYGYSERIQQNLWYADGWWAASRGYWTTTPTVRVNGDLANEADYTVDATEGRVKFTNNAPVDGDTVLVDVWSSLPYDIVEATGLIAAAKFGDRAWAARGFTGLRDVAVAEVRLTRDGARTGAGTATRANIPTEAADKLEGYVFRTIR